MAYFFNSELVERVELEQLCDLVRYRCAWCSTAENPKYDMHGLAIMEQVGTLQVMTGVICRECQAKSVDIKDFR